jgi:hypothetical protein
MHDHHPWVFWRLFEADYKADLRQAANERLARQALALQAGGPSEPSPPRERGYLRQISTGLTFCSRLLIRRRVTKAP